LAAFFGVKVVPHHPQGFAGRARRLAVRHQSLQKTASCRFPIGIGLLHRAQVRPGGSVRRRRASRRHTSLQ
jgi:hypothetical protein